MKKIITLSLALVLALGVFAGCKPKEEPAPEPIAHTYNGLTVTLPADFKDMSNEEYGKKYTFLFGNSDFSLLGLEEKREAVEKKLPRLTPADYASFMVEMNKLDCKATTRDGLPTFTYNAKAENKEYTYVAAVYETANGFWTLQAYCPADKYEQNKDAMWDVLKGVTVWDPFISEPTAEATATQPTAAEKTEK